MEDNIEAINKLDGGLRHLRLRDANQLMKYDIPVHTVARPGFNNTGKEVELQVNAFPINKFPSRTVYQYDVSCPQWTNMDDLLTLNLGPSR